ncbi:hypothetical protein [Kribbella speibonae]|uniref:Uncharacterized protein n=1 Tax=Kribbella speibonae TaxID=1572660 RepID=A0A4R0J9F9_9ACTN|nr:hypothetical protein [Kribbella speibonae]TCC41974.1 hypothetical protein E0H92_10165 [Kribbella speibonae]
MLELPADEPVDIPLDADAFIRVWPELLDRWGTDIATDPDPAQRAEPSQIGVWLAHMREVRAQLDVTSHDPAFDDQPGDPGA